MGEGTLHVCLGLASPQEQPVLGIPGGQGAKMVRADLIQAKRVALPRANGICLTIHKVPANAMAAGYCRRDGPAHLAPGSGSLGSLGSDTRAMRWLWCALLRWL